MGSTAPPRRPRRKADRRARRRRRPPSLGLGGRVLPTTVVSPPYNGPTDLEGRARREGRATARHPSRRGPGNRRRLDHRNRGRSDRRAAGLTDGAICVQRLDDSLNSAIHTRYRSSRRSSSMHEPRGPPLEVVCSLCACCRCNTRQRHVQPPEDGEKTDPQ